MTDNLAVTTASSTRKDRRARVILALSLAALLLRGIVLMRTFDVPGDGPSRAMIAYEWSRAPYFAKAGGWPPGFMYLGGAFAFVVHDPLVSTRMLNVILGSLTVPFLYTLVDRVFGPVAALFSAALLVVLPLHVGLSASSLTETSFLFEMVAGMDLLLRATRASRHRALALGASSFCFVLAEMTRYEAWLLVVPVPAYFYLKTKARFSPALLAVALSLFPVAWTWGNLTYFDDAFAGLTAATNASALGPQSVDLMNAMCVLGILAVDHLGWVVPAAMVGGFLLQLRDAVRRLDVERVFYVAMTGIYWAMMLCFAMARGTSLYNRYLLFGFVISLPFATLPFAWPRRRGRVPVRLWSRAIALIAAAVATFGLSRANHGASPHRFLTPLWVTQEKPVSIERFAVWLAESRFAGGPIVATEMGWLSTYLPLYHTKLTSHFLIVSNWLEDDIVRAFFWAQRPALLLTKDGDEQFTMRVERILNAAIRVDRLVYQEDSLRAYELDGDLYARLPAPP